MGRGGASVKSLAVLYNKMVYRSILRMQLKTVGRRFRLGYSSELINPHLFSFGDNFFSGPHCYFVTNEFSPVSIGNDVMFGPFCKIIGGNHDYTYTKGSLIMNQHPFPEGKEIIIENGAWIGTNAVILTGAYIGEGAVIGAMGLVNHMVPPYTVAVGVPAKRFLARFASDEDLEEVLRNVGSVYTADRLRRIYRECGVETRHAYPSVGNEP